MAPDDTGNGDSPRRWDGALIAALALGASYEEAAEQAGCSRRTVARRMADQEFRQRVDELSAEPVSRARWVLNAALPAAAEQLVDMATAPASITVRPAYVHLRALTVLLDKALTAYELGVLEGRVSKLEERLST